MYEKNGIIYSGEIKPAKKVIFVNPLEDYKLYLLFSTGEYKVFDCKELFRHKIYKQLKNEDLFKSVYLSYGVVSWANGSIDIDPEWIYEDSVLIEEQKN